MYRRLEIIHNFTNPRYTRWTAYYTADFHIRLYAYGPSREKALIRLRRKVVDYRQEEREVLELQEGEDILVVIDREIAKEREHTK